MGSETRESDLMYEVRLGSTVFIAFAVGVATLLAAVGGATRIPLPLAALLAAFVGVGTFVSFYIELREGRL